MSFEERLAEAVKKVVPEAAPNVYEGQARVFATWNFNELGRLFAEGKPNAVQYLAQVHVYLPKKYPWAEIKRQMQQELFKLGGTWPDIIDASDRDGEHLVFEFDAVEGI